MYSFIGGFAIGAYLFGSKDNKIRKKIEEEISNYTGEETFIKPIIHKEKEIIKDNIITILEKIIIELKPENTNGENSET